MSLRSCFILPFIFLLLTRCSEPPTAFNSTSGEFTLLTYNVAGLPQGISPSNPEKNIPLISPLLNKFDIALVQEDFYYHVQLKSQASHPYQSVPKAEAAQFTQGDGINQFSMFPFRLFQRETWQTCSNENGNDCLAKKGFSASEIEIAPGVAVEVYNLHGDAGGGQQDIEARRAQIEQLIERIRTRSTSKAVIVAGDTNLHTESRPEDVALLQKLLDEVELADACRTRDCGSEQVDRVLFRSSAQLALQILSWQIDPDFVDEQGNMLSDHFAISVKFSWQTHR